MAHDLTESVTFDSTVTVPDDGDALLATSVVGALQSLADRSQYNKVNGPDVIANGVPRFRAGVTTDMQNTPASNGDWYFDINRGLFYAWDGTGPDGVITFDNLVTSGKLWWRYDWNSDLEGYSPLIGPNGNSPTNPVGRINPAIQNNYIVACSTMIQGFSEFNNNTSSYTEVTNYSDSTLANLKMWDLITGEISVSAYSSGAGYTFLKLQMNENSTGDVDPIFHDLVVHPNIGINDVGNIFTIPFHHVMTADGLFGLQLFGKGFPTSGITVNNAFNSDYLGRYTVIRP